MVVSPVFHVGTIVHLCAEFESLKSLGTEPLVVPTFYTHGSIVKELLSLMCNPDINCVLSF
jgi:hypothetical protein